MKVVILLITFIVSFFEMSDAADSVIEYYNSLYKDSFAYIAKLAGIAASELRL